MVLILTGNVHHIAQAVIGLIVQTVATFIDLSSELAALRRAAFLLERVRHDGGTSAELDSLEGGIAAMRRAAATGCLVHESAADRLLALLEPVQQSDRHAGCCGDEPPILGAVNEILSLIARMSRSRSDGFLIATAGSSATADH
jgi:hypothetical protein